MNLFNLFTHKKKASKLEVATALLEFVPPSENDILSMRKDMTDIEFRQIEKEVIYFKIFTIDFAVSQALGNSSVRKEVLHLFYDLLKEREFIPSALTDPEKYGIFAARFYTYTEAVKTPHHNGPPWTVGKAFSEICGGGMGSMVIDGFIIFATLYKGVFNFIKEFKIA